MGKNVGKNISKNLSGKYSQKLLDHAKQSGTDVLKTTSKNSKETTKVTGYLVGNKIAIRITKISRSSPQNNSETITNEHEKEIPKAKYRSPEERQKIIDIIV